MFYCEATCLSNNNSSSKKSRPTLTFLSFFPQGCHDAVVELLKKNIQWVIVAALVIALLQVCNINLKKKQKHGALEI